LLIWTSPHLAGLYQGRCATHAFRWDSGDHRV